MTQKGHSAFYGSTSLEGVIAEADSHYGPHKTLSVGQFSVSRSIRVFDVMDIPPDPSVFAPDAADTIAALRFLRRFSNIVSEPRDESADESTHYMPTQIFVLSLLSLPHGEAPEAIRFRSSVAPETENWVVFVDNDHCADAAETDTDELFLILSPESVRTMPPRASE